MEEARGLILQEAVKLIRFEIPYPPKKDMAAWNKRFGLNAYYSGKAWPVRREDAEYLHSLATIAMKKAHIRRELVKGPVEVRFYWNDNLDVDNHAAMGKAFVDAMKGYILPDDKRRWFRKVSHEFWEGNCILVEVEERRQDREKRDGNHKNKTDGPTSTGSATSSGWTSGAPGWRSRSRRQNHENTRSERAGRHRPGKRGDHAGGAGRLCPLPRLREDIRAGPRGEEAQVLRGLRGEAGMGRIERPCRTCANNWRGMRKWMTSN